MIMKMDTDDGDSGAISNLRLGILNASNNDDLLQYIILACVVCMT